MAKYTMIAAAELSTEDLGNLDFAIMVWMATTTDTDKPAAAATLGFTTWAAAEAFIIDHVYGTDETFRMFLASPVFTAMGITV